MAILFCHFFFFFFFAGEQVCDVGLLKQGIPDVLFVSLCQDVQQKNTYFQS